MNTCQMPGSVHSHDLTAIYSGRPEPTYLCGFHASMGLDMSDPRIIR